MAIAGWESQTASPARGLERRWVGETKRPRGPGIKGHKRKEDAAAQGSADPTEPDALLCVEKQRHFEWEGKLPLWFHKPSLAFSDNPHIPPEMLELGINHSHAEMVTL